MHRYSPPRLLRPFRPNASCILPRPRLGCIRVALIAPRVGQRTRVTNDPCGVYGRIAPGQSPGAGSYADSASSRTWLEWLVPRDLMIDRPRLRSPADTKYVRLIQVSAMVEICIGVETSGSLDSSSRLVHITVSPSLRPQSTSRSLALWAPTPWHAFANAERG